MRKFTSLLIIATLIVCLLPLQPLQTHAKVDADEVSIIIEVEGDPAKRAEYFHTYLPSVEVVAIYDKLFNGLALKSSPRNLTEMGSLDFIKAIHPVRKYQATATEIDSTPIMPNAINNTKYTGEGVKVAVIDTGIDYNHPDLDVNYVDGYDLVDLDGDPMETQQKQGMPTMHGTHVSGIIGADGEKFKGVAPDVDLYVYRALGPGGSGSSIQVIAALEQAIEDGVDIINLSLGNTVNGPDFPTSVAVNKAVKLGVAVVIANGNAGPANWTVGSPATASKALSVGASTFPVKAPYLYESLKDKKIPLNAMAGAPAWDFTKDYPTASIHEKNLRGKIAIVKRGKKIPFYDKAKKAQDKGAEAVIIYNNEKGNFHGSVANDTNPIVIPTASISKQDGEWLISNLEDGELFLETNYQEIPKTIASFSSRGPVTVNWDIKPDVVAPGVNILSTVPGGYAVLQGTSMAAPYVAGALALVKEAHPDWTVAQLTNALKTTAKPFRDPNGKLLEPIAQGMGLIDPKAAIQTDTILHEPLLSFGKVKHNQEKKTVDLMVENTTDVAHNYYFTIPKQQQGFSRHLPMEFTVKAHAKKSVAVTLDVTSNWIDKGIHQGYLELNSENETYQLPYLFLNQTGDFQKAMGLGFSLKPFSDDTYMYSLYITDEVEQVKVDLYDPDTLIHQKTLFQIDEPVVGMNEGFIDEKDVGVTGTFTVLVTLTLKDGSYDNFVTEMTIEK